MPITRSPLVSVSSYFAFFLIQVCVSSTPVSFMSFIRRIRVRSCPSRNDTYRMWILNWQQLWLIYVSFHPTFPSFLIYKRNFVFKIKNICIFFLSASFLVGIANIQTCRRMRYTMAYYITPGRRTSYTPCVPKLAPYLSLVPFPLFFSSSFSSPSQRHL